MPFIRALSCALVSLVASSAAAQPPTFSRADYPSSAGPRAIVAADFNRDGAMDLAVASNGTKSVTILLNETTAGGGFRKAHDIVLGGGPFELAAGDVNRDNVVDLVVANADANTIDIVRGDPDGGFMPPIHRGATGNPRGVTLADMDGDGNLDIIYTLYYFQGVQVLHGDGSGWNFEQRSGAATTGENPQGVVTADINWDGIDDIAVVDSGASLLTVLYQTWTRITYERVEVPGQQYLNVLTKGDFNRDGRVDIAAASTARNMVAIYLNGPNGLVYSATIAVGSSPRGIEAEDINRDGVLDLVTANRGSNTVSILFGEASPAGTFAAPVTVAAGAGSRDVALADFNRDNQMDIATANEYGGSVTILTNTSKPPQTLFWHAQGLPSVDPGGFVALGDVNKNGRVDVLTGRGIILDGTTFVELRSNNQNYRYAPDGTFGDFNNDGNQDVAMPSRYYGSETVTGVDLYYGDGAGGFRFGGALPSNYPFEISASDLNGDARVDLVLLSGLTPTFDTLEVFLASATGFQPKITIDLPGYGRGLDVGDMNRDGKPDVVVALAGSHNGGVFVGYGDGLGRFPQTKLLPVSHGLWQIDAIDINGDGVLDIAGANSTHLLVWLGNSTNEYTISQPHTTRVMEARFLIADITGDGRLDLFSSGDGLHVGQSDGTFGEPQRVNVQWQDAEAVDYDRDGKTDVVLTNYEIVLVLSNRTERGENLPPVAGARESVNVAYEWFFEDEVAFGSQGSYDPNLDVLAYEWKDASGNIVSLEPWVQVTRREPGTYQFTLTVRDGYGGEDSTVMKVNVLPIKEAVSHAEVGYYQGAWRREEDNTAAGARAWHPNANAPKLSAPLASPTNFVEIYTLADTTQQYKMWLRLKAENNSWANDSVFVQFEHGVIVNGQTRYKIGTTDALDINLEQCSGCGVSGWGWRDERWGSTLSAPPMLLRFAQGGWQRVRIQTREDGVSFDQFVLSSEQYRTTPPGAAKNDTTILPSRP